MNEPPPERLALGYVRKYPGLTVRTIDQLRQRLSKCAEANGYRLLEVHIEERQTDPTAFFALIASIAATGAEAVVVPTRAHLGREQIQDSKITHLRRTTNAEVLILSHDG
jgi:hypothetical protein